MREEYFPLPAPEAEFLSRVRAMRDQARLEQAPAVLHAHPAAPAVPCEGCILISATGSVHAHHGGAPHAP